jgi:DNA-binding response OmpR family regulator
MLKPVHVLVVDDHPGMCALIAAWLDEQGLRATTCTDAATALEVLSRESIGLIITDGKMQGMDGLDFIRAARARHPAMAIILMTAYTDEFTLSDALEAGADGYLSKPFTMEKLALILQRAYWTAISREDWWVAHCAEADAGSPRG